MHSHPMIGSAKTVIFLDVDGVVNAIGSPTYDYRTGDARPEEGFPQSFRITWREDIIERLNALSERDDVEILWLTTWGRGANGELRELIGINELQVAHHPDELDVHTYGHDWWKWRVIKEFRDAAPDVRFIWIDDDLLWEKEARLWAHNNRVYAISPASHRGLTLSDIERIENLADSALA